MPKVLRKVVLVSDGSGHDYLIPEDLEFHFYRRLYEAGEGEAKAWFSISGEYKEGYYTFIEFEEEFETYSVEGSYDIYAYFEEY